MESRPGALVVAFVPGVTPGKWERIWRDRMRGPRLELRPASQTEALEWLRSGEAHMAFLRDVLADDDLYVIPLYYEVTVVVASKDSPVKAFDSLVLADLAGETVLEGSDAATVDLVAANVGLALMPMSVARAHSRRDVIARPVTDAPESEIGLAWPSEHPHPLVNDFIGIVRGRTPNSSR
jgi:DNA-binding transcriptional LysR family regulator